MSDHDDRHVIMLALNEQDRRRRRAEVAIGLGLLVGFSALAWLAAPVIHPLVSAGCFLAGMAIARAGR